MTAVKSVRVGNVELERDGDGYESRDGSLGIVRDREDDFFGEAEIDGVTIETGTADSAEEAAEALEPDAIDDANVADMRRYHNARLLAADEAAAREAAPVVEPAPDAWPPSEALAVRFCTPNASDEMDTFDDVGEIIGVNRRRIIVNWHDDGEMEHTQEDVKIGWLRPLTPAARDFLDAVTAMVAR